MTHCIKLGMSVKEDKSETLLLRNRNLQCLLNDIFISVGKDIFNHLLLQPFIDLVVKLVSFQ